MSTERPAASVQPWQRPLLALMDRLAKTPGSSLKWHIGRKREGIVVVDKDGKVIE